MGIPTDLRPSPATPLATPPYHKKLQMFLFTTKGRGITWSYPGSWIWTSQNSEKAKFTEIAHLPIAPPTSPRRNAALGRSFSDHSPTANIYSRWQHPPLRISIHRCYKL